MTALIRIKDENENIFINKKILTIVVTPNGTQSGYSRIVDTNLQFNNLHPLLTLVTNGLSI